MCRFPVNCRSQWNIIIVPARIKLKSPLNTQEAVQIVRATWRRLLKARINDCHRRLKRYENKHNYTTNWNIWRLLPTNEPTKTTECSHTGHQQATLSRQRELSEPTKDNIRRRIASTVQSASLHDSNLTKDQRDALKRLKNNDKWNLNCGWFWTEDVHTCESFLLKYDCFTETEEELDDALRKGDFDDINQKVTPETLSRCKSNTLLKAFQVGIITWS